MQTPSSLRPRPATAQAARLRAPVPRALAYGVALRAWPIVVANAVTLCLAAAILAMKLRYGRSR